VPKRIRLVNTCDSTAALTENIQIASNDLFVPHVMQADADGYYSVLLPKHKWNNSGELSVSAPEFHEKKLSLDPFYKEGPFNTRNDVALVPDRRQVTFEITRSADVAEDAFSLTYQVEPGREMRLRPDFKNSDLFTETLFVPVGKRVGSFALTNHDEYILNLVEHVQDPDHLCGELIRLRIEKIAD